MDENRTMHLRMWWGKYRRCPSSPRVNLLANLPFSAYRVLLGIVKEMT